MKKAENSGEDDHLRRLISEYSEDQVCLLEVLRFWIRHPSARFNQPAIIHSFNFNPSLVKSALTYLISKAVVIENHQTPIHYYHLTESEPLRSELLNLSRKDWSQQNLIQQGTGARGKFYA